MFQMAGRAVAVGNAIPKVKACAHEIIGINDEDCVAAYLRKTYQASGA